MNPLILLGSGGHSVACADVIESTGNFSVAGLVVAEPDVSDGLSQQKILGKDSDLADLFLKFKYALVGIGQIGLNPRREVLYDLLVALGYKLPSVVSSVAYVSTRAEIKSGSIVMHGSIVNSGAIIGHNCIINSRSLIEHNSFISDHCHISTGALINGNVSVGPGSFIGSGAIIGNGVTIGEYAVIGAGRTILCDVPDYGVVTKYE